MRAAATRNGLTLRVVAGTHSAILGIDLQGDKRKGCLGFAIRRADLGPAAGPAARKPATHWLPNMIGFPGDAAAGPHTTETAPLQKFRWGDYTLAPGCRYRFRVVPRYGKPGALTDGPGLADGVEVEVATEDPDAGEAHVTFNRAAAASKAFGDQFPGVTAEADLHADTAEARRARAWLSNGLEEAILAFLDRAEGGSHALHAAVYEFQKPELLAGLKAAAGRGVEVKVVYHARVKPGGQDTTAEKNLAAIEAANFGGKVHLVPRRCNPQGAIMHNKFVVLLEKEGKHLVPKEVLTGSTNWTDGGVYGQLNVAHALRDPAVAAAYESYFELLADDTDAEGMKDGLATLTPVSVLLPGGHGVTPVFSPQHSDTMLHLYAALCEGASCVMVSAPFALAPVVLAALAAKREGVLRYLLLDKMASLGKGEQVHVFQNDAADSIAAAMTLKSPLHDFQGRLLEGKESFRHAGIHIHSKVILIDPFGSDPVVVTGSANFSRNSTEVNDSNSLVPRGQAAVTDVYVTEFMRMFEHYHFRASLAAAGAADKPLGLAADDGWSAKYYVKGSSQERDRRMFAGTH